jgi:hypothetical protein
MEIKKDKRLKCYKFNMINDLNVTKKINDQTIINKRDKWPPL